MARKAMLSLFGREPAAEQSAINKPGAERRTRERQPLPPSVIASVEAASVVVRPSSREEGFRAIVTLPGRSAWVWSREKSADVFAAGWPDLTLAQIASAASRLASLVHLHMQNAAAWNGPDGPPSHIGWMNRY